MHKATKIAISILLVLTLSSGLVMLVRAQSSQSNINVSINADGSVTPSTADIRSSGGVYTLTGNISGGLTVHRGNIVIDGTGFALNGAGGVGVNLENDVTQVPSTQEIFNVTIENLLILNFNYSVKTNGGGNDVFYNDYIANNISGLRGGVFLWGCSDNLITNCTINGDPAVFFDFCSSGNQVTGNNLTGGIWLEVGGNETVDGNYWSDYQAKYPNAAQNDSAGTWSTPYAFTTYGSVTGSVVDNHPLMDPVTCLGSQANPEQNPAANAKPIPELSVAATLTVLTLATITLTVSTRKKASKPCIGVQCKLKT